MNSRLPILLYHRIENSSASTATAPEVFRRQLAWLKEQGWRTLSTREFAALANNGRQLPARSFMITFDDGYETVRTVALDILREFDFKAVSFLSTALLSEQRGDSQDDAYMTWQQARELQESGMVDCQSHSHAHDNFTGYSMTGIESDLGTSLDLLAAGLRLPRAHFRHLAWPWGLSRPEWRQVASRLGFAYQYGVARQSCRLPCQLDQIPRTCFDASSFVQFQRQLWLQSGRLSPIWELAYPLGRKFRHIASSIHA